MLKINDSGLILAQPDTLELLQQWTEAKAEEIQANLRRKQIEDQLAGRTSDCPPEGQKTYRFPHWKVVRTNKFNYRGDIAKLLPLARELEIEPPVSQKISESACKRLRTKEPTTWEILVEEGAVACQEAKPQFDIVQVPS